MQNSCTSVFFVFFAVLKASSDTPLFCPDNAFYESLTSCNPATVPSVCSVGYRCRPATVGLKERSAALSLPFWNAHVQNPITVGYPMTSTVLPFWYPQKNASISPERPNLTLVENSDAERLQNSSNPVESSQIVYLCCSSENMTCSDYFVEAGYSPSAVPTAPASILESVIMSDYKTGYGVAVSGIGSQLSTLTQPENGQNDTNATFLVLEALSFDIPPNSGGFLHFVVAIDPLLIPTAIYLYYNFPNFGLPIINITDFTHRFPRGYAEHVGNVTLPPQSSYKSDRVVLIFHTTQPLAPNSTIQSDLKAANGDLGFFLSTTSTGQNLSIPIYGTFFTLETSGTVFTGTSSGTTVNLSAVMMAVCYGILILGVINI